MEKRDELNSAKAASLGVPGGNPPADSSNREIRELKVEIAENQAQLQETVAEIQERLSPTHLKEQATTAVRDATIGRVENVMNRAGETAGELGRTTRQAAQQVASTIANNPLPYVLIGLGAACLLVHRQTSRRWDDDEYDSGAFDTTDYSSMSTASSIGARGTSESGSQQDARNRARDMASTVRGRFTSMLQENPLVLGVAAMATGALVAAALPATGMEQRYMGGVSESLLESAKEIAQGAVEKVTGTGSPQSTGSPHGID